MNLPIEERALMALQAAVAKVIENHVRDMRPIWGWRDGKVVDLLPEELAARSEKSRTA